MRRLGEGLLPPLTACTTGRRHRSETVCPGPAADNGEERVAAGQRLPLQRAEPFPRHSREDRRACLQPGGPAVPRMGTRKGKPMAGTRSKPLFRAHAILLKPSTTRIPAVPLGPHPERGKNAMPIQRELETLMRRKASDSKTIVLLVHFIKPDEIVEGPHSRFPGLCRSGARAPPHSAHGYSPPPAGEARGPGR